MPAHGDDSEQRSGQVVQPDARRRERATLRLTWLGDILIDLKPPSVRW